MSNDLGFNKQLLLGRGFNFEIYYLLSEFDKNKIIPMFFNKDKNSRKDFNKFLKTKYFPKLIENELDEAKITFIQTKIIEKDDMYVSIFEDLLKDKFKEIGLNSFWLNDKEFLLSKEFENKILELPLSCFNIAISISGYYIFKDNKEVNLLDKGYLLNRINNVLQVDNILDEKLYLRYKNKRILEICKYLEINENEIEKFFWYLNEFLFESFLWNETNLLNDEKKDENFNLIQNKCKEIDSLLFQNFPTLNLDIVRNVIISLKDFLMENHIEVNPFDYDTFINYFRKELNKSLLIHLYKVITNNHNEYSLSMIVRLAILEDNEILPFLNEVLTRIYLDYIYENLKEKIANNNILLNNSQKIDTTIFENEIKEKDLIIENLQNEKEAKSLKNISLQKELNEYKEKSQKQTKQIENSYKKELSNLKKQLELLNKENKKLKEDTIELNEIRETLLSLEDEKENEISLDKIDLTQFEDKRYIFVGGRFELLKKLEEIFPKGKFYHVKPQNGIDITKTDKIVIFPKNINHPLYWEAIDIAKKNNIPFIFTLGTNLETVMKDIVKNV